MIFYGIKTNVPEGAGLGAFSSRFLACFPPSSHENSRRVWCECVCGAWRAVYHLFSSWRSSEVGEKKFPWKRIQRVCVCAWEISFSSSYSSFSSSSFSHFILLVSAMMYFECLLMLCIILFGVSSDRSDPSRWCERLLRTLFGWWMRWWHKNISSDEEIWLSLGNAAVFLHAADEVMWRNMS